MRLSWGRVAFAASGLVIAVTISALPSRVLAPAHDLQAPISLPQSLSPAVVLASPVVGPKAARRHKPPTPTPPPTIRPVAAPIPAVPVASRPEPRRSRPSPVIQAPP